MIVGYARVSTVGQDYDSQVEQLKEAGCEKVFNEKVTATSTKARTELKDMIEFVRAGDTVVVTKIDRLARSILDLNKIVTQLADKGVTVKFLSESMEFNADDTNSLQSLLFNVLGSFAQFERDLIIERTTEGRERAKAQGIHMGRPAQSKKRINEALQLYDNREVNGFTVTRIAEITRIPRSTIYHELKKRA